MEKKQKHHSKRSAARSAEGSGTQQKRLAPMMRALKAVHTLASNESTDPDALELQRKSHEVLGRLVTPMIGMEWLPFPLDGMPAAWTRPDRGHDPRRAILYCHGGGYTCGSLGYARILSSKLAQVTGYPVLSFGYRLAPEHPYPAALEDALKAWDYLMYQGYGARDIIVAGDSAGGNLALVLTLKLRQQGRLLPRALALMSPWTDMTASGRSYTEHAQDDPILTLDYIKAVRTAYAGQRELSDPLLSPLFADFTGFPPVMVQVGEHEILRSDSVRLRDRLVMRGIPCRLELWKQSWHVFQMFPIKRANEAMDSMGQFLRDLF